ncbi:MAG: histidine phosphatase family protein [Nitriliruptoraceae bacterium]|nr:histidine phosphatase family protein [Nitriliruptoraceae bacterium]
MPVTIDLLRHAAVDADGLAYGRRHDPPLSAAGVAQLTPQVLGDLTHDLVLRSPTRRTEQTAALLGRPTADTDPRWTERDLGDWEGQPWERIWAQVPADVTTDPAAFVAHRPTGGESVAELRARTVEALTDLAARLAPDARALVITHAGPIVCAVAHALGLSDAVATRLRPPPATRTTLTWFGDGTWTIDRFGA